MATKDKLVNLEDLKSVYDHGTGVKSELHDIRVGADGITYPSAGDAVRGQVSAIGGEIEKKINNIVDDFSILAPYLYKENTYINTSMAETTLTGYNLHKIPVSQGDVVCVRQISGSTAFWNTLNVSYAFRFLNSNSTYSNAFGTTDYGGVSTADKYALVIIPANVTHLMVTAYGAYSGYVEVCKNTPFKELNGDAVSKYETVMLITDKNSFQTKLYRTNTQKFQSFSGTYFSNTLKIKKDDKIVFNGTISGLSFLGTFTTEELVTSHITTSPFIAPSDGMLAVFGNVGVDYNGTLYPANSVKIDYSNLKNIPATGDNPYSGLNAVAFGTSLTYRAQTTGGYLQYLPDLSGITFDNQGIGSSVILANGSQPSMMTAITGYSSWSNKRVCILEGFVNDWYYNGASLGTWKDIGTTTVCGCVRTALTHILTQNANLTVFLILDHFGKGITASTAVNSAGQTQLEFYQELEKLALNMGIRVIREYELSEISELTPQYLLDNIHLNDLGAKQSAYAIWSAMKQSYPNVIS